jgi:hypothetical protein
LDIVDYVIGWIHNITDDVNCTAIFESSRGVVDTICDVDPTWGTYNCSNLESSYTALCALVTNPELHLVDPSLQLALLEATGISVESVLGTIQAEAVSVLDSATNSLYPESLYMLTVPLGIAIAFALMNAIYLAVSYIPSVTTTIIQLRTGVIPSLGDPEFEKYRVAPDTVTLLTGTIFWGGLVSSALVGFIFGLIFFLLLWQSTQRMVQKLTVILVGLLVIVIIRILVRRPSATIPSWKFHSFQTHPLLWISHFVVFVITTSYPSFG